MKKISDDDSLEYFRKWVELINLEQSANNVNILSQYNSLSLGDKGAIKDMNLNFVEVISEKDSSSVTVVLERLFFQNHKANFNNGTNQIKLMSNVNLLTIN